MECLLLSMFVKDVREMRVRIVRRRKVKFIMPMKSRKKIIGYAVSVGLRLNTSNPTLMRILSVSTHSLRKVNNGLKLWRALDKLRR